METINWLMTLCIKHHREFKKKTIALKNAKIKKEPDADFEFNFHIKFVEDFVSIPENLTDLSPIGVLMLAYFTKQTIGGDGCIKGYEILEKLQSDDAGVHTTTYLLAYDELESKGWLVFNYDKDNILRGCSSMSLK